MCLLGKNKYFKENLSCMLLKMIKFIGYEPIYLKNPPSSLQDEAEISSVVYRWLMLVNHTFTKQDL